MSKSKDKPKDKYNIQWDINGLNASSARELTGLIPSAPISDDEIESYNDLMTFSSKDIVADGNEDNENQTPLNAKKTGNNFTNKKNDKSL